ncbi:hypothetical protein H2198_004421 [Neophaeococcomyces mojaviensis]|uniref:Uncharacterized protein n=1 Tax=Neophaeococcomyces mojaviensis TaxID=3383035 RepID=A0ACC3A8M1_9EURO|nr:hypothetical protein H2198_004421 [Knufia sp. JES_112]
MATTQHDPALAASRISGITDTPVRRPTATTANLEEEAELKHYTCLYFGYASNLSPRTIKQRCPDSLFISLARLSGWRWIINETGYANIVPGDAGDEVWGSLSFLSYRDEVALDESEGVPFGHYDKMKLKVRRIPQDIAGDEWRAKDPAGEEVEAIAYVNPQLVAEGKIEQDYVIWVRKAIKDAKSCGMPEAYAQKYMAKYLPKEEGDLPDPEKITMVRSKYSQGHREKDADLLPRGFWGRG